MKIKKLFSVIISIISLIVSIVLLVLFFTTKEKTPTDIFNDTILSVVEVRASMDETESFGSGVIINEEGYFITNAHVIKREKD